MTGPAPPCATYGDPRLNPDLAVSRTRTAGGRIAVLVDLDQPENCDLAKYPQF